MGNARNLAQQATLPPVFRNRLNNGDMRVDQRRGGAAVSGQEAYVADRWAMAFTGTSLVASMQRVAEGPAGLTFSAKATITTARGAIAASDAAYCYQPIEGQNLADFQYGTAGAKTATLSFWVKSSVTGTYAGFLRGALGTSPPAFRSYVFQYTINAANVWEYKTVTIPGDAGGAFNLDNNGGLGVLFDLGSGSANEAPSANTWLAGNYYRIAGAQNICGTLNATWQVTGVQFELGAVATPFEQRSFAAQLAECQRYFQSIAVPVEYRNTNPSAATVWYKPIMLLGPMRIAPTVVLPAQGFIWRWDGVDDTANTTWNVHSATPDGFAVHVGHSAGIGGLKAFTATATSEL